MAEFYNGVGWKCASPKVSVLTNFHTIGGTLRVCFAVDTRRIAERFSAKNSSANCIKLKPDEMTEVVYRKFNFFVAKAKSLYIYMTPQRALGGRSSKMTNNSPSSGTAMIESATGRWASPVNHD